MSTPSESTKLPYPFVMRRLHSLLGLWLAIYLFEHLLVNSQMALYFQDDGSSFIKMVNKIHAMPFLKVIEITVLGLPFLVHGLWGIRYALTSKSNSYPSKGNKPSLPEYKRNRAFTWQRLTSWILLFGIIGHVAQMRFINYPTLIYEGQTKHYYFPVEESPAVLKVASNVKTSVLTPDEVATLGFHVKQGDIYLDAPNAGTAFLILVRETFKSPLMVILYSIFVVAAAYHGFNGLWTFLITWGVTLSERAQGRARILTTLLMWGVMFLGLMAIWGTYWTIQFQG